MSHPFTDIVIPVHNALDYLRNCVETVCYHTSGYRIIFVDDICDAATKEYMQRCLSDHHDWLLVQTAKQKWFSRASNLGLRLARTPRVVLLNSDCGVGPNWLQALYDTWADVEEKNPGSKIGLVGSVKYDEKPAFPYLLTNFQRVEAVYSYVTGHCYLISMEAVEDLARRRGTPGWYFNERDPGQIHIASDRILCWDLNKADYLTVGTFTANVGHHGGKSWGYNVSAIPYRVEDVD